MMNDLLTVGLALIAVIGGFAVGLMIVVLIACTVVGIWDLSKDLLRRKRERAAREVWRKRAERLEAERAERARARMAR